MECTEQSILWTYTCKIDKILQLVIFVLPLQPLLNKRGMLVLLKELTDQPVICGHLCTGLCQSGLSFSMEPQIDDEPQILHPGPLDESLLTRQRYHRSEDIWNGEDPGPLTCRGGFLLGRTLAVLITMTLGTSMAARQGPVAMAAHQICIRVWLAVSLLTDALAASGQVFNNLF
ncbi:hypothetical protein CMV_004682 [Castanea mollissima]|uniref:Uncharacterized protein n=1 Tax=Castanea mollissima TaxID=60419 RepID=A0A8J4RP09_9ROSI|nr:hypothetical protein CMV_004682 [Castanea mollissima]